MTSCFVESSLAGAGEHAECSVPRAHCESSGERASTASVEERETTPALGDEPHATYGACRRCSCPGFWAASGYTCHRNGCNHHYDEHW